MPDWSSFSIEARRARGALLRTTIALSVAFFTPGTLHAQDGATLVIFARDATTQAPLAGVLVRVNDEWSGLTDPAGVVRLARIPPGQTSLAVRRLGYHPRSMPLEVIAPVTSVTILLEPDPVQLAEVRAQGHALLLHPQAQAFYQRMRMGNGYFITRADIEEQKPRKISHLLERVPNLEWTEISSVASGHTIVRSRRAGRASKRCKMHIYVDGVFDAPASGFSAAQSMAGSEDDAVSPLDNIDAAFDVNEIEAIEVYPGANVPAQFGRGGATCGVIALWTRHGRLSRRTGSSPAIGEGQERRSPWLLPGLGAVAGLAVGGASAFSLDAAAEGSGPAVLLRTVAGAAVGAMVGTVVEVVMQRLK